MGCTSSSKVPGSQQISQLAGILEVVPWDIFILYDRSVFYFSEDGECPFFYDEGFILHQVLFLMCHFLVLFSVFSFLVDVRTSGSPEPVWFGDDVHTWYS